MRKEQDRYIYDEKESEETARLIQRHTKAVMSAWRKPLLLQKIKLSVKTAFFSCGRSAKK
ncbi:hypothetical protein [Bacillus sp. HNA3]|uniref:hypothetical protein n=1 Tax=Bacillus sp. HNA3 TaxID=2585772 RepID=UPI001454C374|nr:hypothetical protein [Bacillus sp. HNA3]